MPYAEVPTFVERLRSGGPDRLTALAFEFLILTATRTSEVLHARWPEVDLAKGVWTIPANRMKAHREHRVPLSAQAVDILTEARALGSSSPWLFPGRSLSKPLSNMTFLMALRRMGLTITAHGFRSAFRDWAAEQTNFPREVCEMALAHTIKDKAEAAYRRGDLFEKRRNLMETWAGYISLTSGKVIDMTTGSNRKRNL
jgi:integrase